MSPLTPLALVALLTAGAPDGPDPDAVAQLAAEGPSLLSAERLFPDGVPARIIVPELSPELTEEGSRTRLDIGLIHQIDLRAAPSRPGEAVDMRLRRMRTPLSLSLDEGPSLHFLPGFGEGGRDVTIFDAYADVTVHPAVALRLGQWRSPVALTRLQPGISLLALERGPVALVAPVRELGAAALGHLGPVEYHLGVFGGAQDNLLAARRRDRCHELAGRVAFHTGPLMTGLSGSAGCAVGGQPRGLRTASGASILDYADGTRFSGPTRRVGGHLLLEWERLHAMAEVLSSQMTLDAKSAGSAPQSIRHVAWQLSVAVALSDDQSRFSGLRPKRDASLSSKGGRHPGAIEAALTYGQIHLDPRARAGLSVDPDGPGVARVTQAALNWYLSSSVKVQLNWDHTAFDNGRRADDMVGLRLQTTLSSKRRR